ncbi:MAG: carboxypeptidase-like regulatory domain-containing protein [Saprospiraceae bacterium]|nr:carboxypeptidase-like regulatory domain-containing protein [Saprospiraceae bacterium]
MKTRQIALILYCLSFTLIIQAQTIKGKIIDDVTGETLIGANILIKGTDNGTITDFDGAFELKVTSLPAILTISYLGYKSKDVEVKEARSNLNIKLESEAITLGVVETVGQRVSDKQKASPLTVESLDVLGIKQAASDNFYDGLGALKGVDLTAASLGFKVINTRGFNSTSPVRSLQIIDGIDNQAPGLNFSLGNFLGSSELDVLRVDMVQGASSSFYGPNAFNGVISMETKNPFYQKGLSVYAKAGERNMLETAFRWAATTKNKDGLERFGYKVNFSFLRADDWIADNYEAVTGTPSLASNPGGYDAINIYGDEYQASNDLTSSLPWLFPGIGVWHRPGYKEIDLVDYGTRNIKANAALHFRTRPIQKDESPELILGGNFGSGTTVYQGDNRFSLRDILFFQGKMEFRKRDKFFIRAYFTQDDAGNSYDPYFTALKLQELGKSNRFWSTDYINVWQRVYEPKIFESGYPRLKVMVDPNGNFTTSFDQVAATQWINTHQELLKQYHSEASALAQKGNPLFSTQDAYEVGTARFDEAFNQIRTTYNNEGGTRFYDNSALYHAHGEYKFNPRFVNTWTVGGNMRLYAPESRGTIFYDTAGTKITNFEFGFYTGMEKKTNNDKFTFSATARLDKNANFGFLFSPAASVVFKPKAGNFLRFSFASAIRNPTLSDQYLFLNVGRAILAGNINGAQGLITVNSFFDYVNTLDTRLLKYFDIDPIRPEKVKTFEVGYRTTLFNKLFADMGYYYSIYNDFLGYNIGITGTFDPISGFPSNIQAYRYAANSTNQVTTQGASIGLSYYFSKYYQLSGNYSWNKLNKDFEDDPIIPAFNTPEHKYNLGFSGRDIPLKIGGMRLNEFGFNINYKWIDAFQFEGSPQFTGFIPSYDLLDAQINWKLRPLNTTIKLGASNLLDNRQFQAYGGPKIGRLAYLSLLYEWKKIN